MAQSNEDQQQEILLSIQIEDYVVYSMLCLVVYEFVITLDQEIAVVWRRKFTLTSLLLLSTRWLMLLNPI
ncbi:uncharacterized protein PHACADRAFT_140967, partial [Phanerochaete carnosa HHB-10118-sp]